MLERIRLIWYVTTDELHGKRDQTRRDTQPSVGYICLGKVLIIQIFQKLYAVGEGPRELSGSLLSMLFLPIRDLGCFS